MENWTNWKGYSRWSRYEEWSTSSYHVNCFNGHLTAKSTYINTNCKWNFDWRKQLGGFDENILFLLFLLTSSSHHSWKIRFLPPRWGETVRARNFPPLRVPHADPRRRATTKLPKLRHLRRKRKRISADFSREIRWVRKARDRSIETLRFHVLLFFVRVCQEKGYLL